MLLYGVNDEDMQDLIRFKSFGLHPEKDGKPLRILSQKVSQSDFYFNSGCYVEYRLYQGDYLGVFCSHPGKI